VFAVNSLLDIFAELETEHLINDVHDISEELTEWAIAGRLGIREEYQRDGGFVLPVRFYHS